MKRIIVIFMVLAVLFTSIVPTTFATSSVNDKTATIDNILNDSFFDVLSAIKCEASKFGTTEFELTDLYIGAPLQTFELQDELNCNKNLTIYPFLYHDTIVADAFVWRSEDGLVKSVTADAELISVFQDAYREEREFILVYYYGALYFATEEKTILVQNGYLNSDCDKQNVDSIENYIAENIVRYETIAFYGERLIVPSDRATLYYTANSINVPLVNQNNASGGSNLCWAACCSSIGEYYTTVTYTPREISYLFTTSNYWSGSPSYNASLTTDQIPDVLYYFYALNFNNTSALVFNKLVTEIDADNPIYTAFECTYGGSVIMRHAIVIRGYGDYDGFNDSNGTYSFMDPNGGAYRVGTIISGAITAVLYGYLFELANWRMKT